MNMKSCVASVVLCAAVSAAQAQNVSTDNGDLVIIETVEKNQVATVAAPVGVGAGTTTLTTTLVGGLTVGTAVIGAVTLAVVIGVVGSGTGS